MKEVFNTKILDDKYPIDINGGLNNGKLSADAFDAMHECGVVVHLSCACGAFIVFFQNLP